MKSTTHFKYIEFRDTKGLHEDTLQTLSDLKFLKDELRFLKNLVASNTLALIYGKSPEESKTLYNLLMEHSKRLEKLIQEVKVHSNNLQILLDDTDVPNELKLYKDTHYKLIIDELNFHADVKKLKRIIFKMLADIMKSSKQKKLL